MAPYRGGALVYNFVFPRLRSLMRSLAIATRDSEQRDAPALASVNRIAGKISSNAIYVNTLSSYVLD